MQNCSLYLLKIMGPLLEQALYNNPQIVAFLPLCCIIQKNNQLQIGGHERFNPEYSFLFEDV